MRVWAFPGTIIAAVALVTAVAYGADTRATAAPFLTPITAKFDADRRATVYTVDLKTTDATGAGKVIQADRYVWKLDPAADDPTCDELRVSPDKPNEATWFHADSDGCTHKGIDHAGAVVGVTVTYGTYTCTARYEGSQTGTGPVPAACISSQPACVGQRAAVAKWSSTVTQLEGLVADAKQARNAAELTIGQAERELEAIVEKGAGFWDTLAGGGAYRNRYDQAAAELASAKKALAEIRLALIELQKELAEARQALAKATAALQACLGPRTSYAVIRATACEAQARALVVARAARATVVSVRVRLTPPARRARAAAQTAAALLAKPAPGLPAPLRASATGAAGKARAAERVLSKLVSGLAADARAAKRRVASATAKLAACKRP